MNRCEKIAWFNLAVLSVSTVLYIVLFLLLRMKFDLFLSAQIATSAFALVAVTAFGPVIFKNTGTLIDEQGAIIRPGYRLLWYLLFWAAYFSISIVVWVLIKFVGHASISDQAGLLVVFLYITFSVMMVFILYLYFARQKESKLRAEEQSAADVVLFGPDMDERDLKIQRSARWSGFGAFWMVYVFGIMGTWARVQFSGARSISIDINIIPLFVFGAFILILAVDSIVQVILYRQGN